MNTSTLKILLRGLLLGLFMSLQLSAQTSVRIGLQASNGQWMCAELIGGRAVVTNRGDFGPWEHFNLLFIEGGSLKDGDRIAMQSADGRFFCAEHGGGSTVVANRTAIGPWEKFTLERIGGGGAIVDGDYVAIRTVDGYYLGAQNGGGGVVNAVASGVGSWETFRVTIEPLPERSDSVSVDVNGDGIPDEIVKSSTYRFKTYIANWYTYCYDYWSYPVNDYYYPWDYNFNPWWGNDTQSRFSDEWYPDPFWISYSYYSYCDTFAEPALDFVSDGGSNYQVYKDSSGGSDYNPSTWQLVLSVGGLGDGINTIYLGSDDVNNIYQGKYFLVKLGKQPPPASYDASLFYNGTYTLSEFADYMMNAIDAGAVDPDVAANPEVDDAMEEAIENILREATRQAQRPKTDPNLLLRRIIVVQIIIEVIDQWPVSYCVYRKWDASNDKAYIGRTAGAGDPWSVVKRRDAKPDRAAMNAAGYKPADVHSWICTYGLSKFGYCTMRGREQNVMDNYEFVHGKKSSFNIARGVRANNPMRYAYYLTSKSLYGSIFLFTGDTPGSHVYDILTWVPPDKFAYGWDTIQPYAGL